jgi:molecular chaperone HscA
VILGPKRLVGTRFTPSLTAQLQNSYGALLVNNDGEMAFSTRRGVTSPEEICAEIIRHNLNAAEVVPNVTSIAMTVPVAFDDRRRRALVSVARQLGFTRIRLLEEPVATAVSYLGRCNVQRAAVFDLGGGTFDFSIIGCNGKHQNIEVLATGGDDALGGDEIDQTLAEWAAVKILAQTGWDLKNEKNVFAQVIAAAEQAKIALTQKEEAYIALDVVDDAAPIALPQIKISRNTLFELALPLIQKMFLICDEVLHKAETSTKNIDAVFMSGSGSLLYGLKGAVAKYFGLPARTDIDPAFVVSVGAGLAMARPSLHSLFLRI